MPPRMRLFFREPTVDTNRPIASRQIGVEGFDVEIVDSMADADVWDCPFAGRMLDFETSECVSIPAFPNRKFRLAYIFVNAAAGIRTPQDLHGKRVGIRFWSNTAGVWARGALQHHYGVDLTRIHWLSARKDATPIPPGAIDIAYQDEMWPRDMRDLDDMLADGDIDALIDANVPPSIVRRNPRTRRLFPDYAAEERAYYSATGIFPISHLVTLRGDFVKANPAAPQALLRAFRHARDMAFEAIEGSDPQVLVLSWISHYLDEQRKLMGDNYFTYDIAHNRTALDAMMRYAHAQWLTPRVLRAEELFHASVIDDVE